MTLFYAIIQFLFWFAYGTAVNFSGVYLLDRGLSNTVIGVISSVACILSVFIQPALAAYADRKNAVSIKAILLIMFSIQCGIGGITIFCYERGAAVNGLLMAAAILMVQIALPFVNALATEMINAGRKINFSLARGFGSIGYAVMSLTIGRLSALHGADRIPWGIMASALLIFIAIACFRFVKADREKREEVKDSVGIFFGKYPIFPVILIGCTLIYASHVYINNFLFQIVTFKGGTSEHMGIVMSLAGVLEILSMFFFPLLLKWKESSFWFRVCGIFFTLKALGTLLAGSMGVLYAVQFIQPLGWGLMIVSSVYYVNERMKSEDKIKGQAYMTMTLSAGAIVGSLTGGWLIDNISVNGMLAVAVLAGFLGTVIIMAKAEQLKRLDTR